MSATETAAEGAVEAVQAAAKPVAFIATVIASAAIVGFLVRRLGRALPLPDYASRWLPVDPDPNDDDDQEDTDDDD